MEELSPIVILFQVCPGLTGFLAHVQQMERRNFPKYSPAAGQWPSWNLNSVLLFLSTRAQPLHYYLTDK